MKNEKQNTFGDYEFERWVPAEVRDMIRDFWGCFGRTHKDWLAASKEQDERKTCQHGPGPNGFGMPPTGAHAEYFIYDRANSDAAGYPLYRIVSGRYIHWWNNMGSLIDAAGNSHCVSTCDRWVRVYV